MSGVAKWGVAIALAFVTLCAPASAVAEESTLTQVREAVESVRAEVAADKVAVESVKGEVEGVKSEVHSTLPLLESGNALLGGTLKVSCSGCGGEGGSSTVTFSEAARNELDGDFGTLAMLLWLIVGVLLGQVAFAIWDRRAAQ